MDAERGCAQLTRPLEAPLDEGSPDAAPACGRVDDEGAKARPACREVAPALERDVPVEGDRSHDLAAVGCHVGLGEPESIPDIHEVGEVVVEGPVVRRSPVYLEGGLEERGDPIELVLAGGADDDAQGTGGRARVHPDPTPPLLRRSEAVHGSARA